MIGWFQRVAQHSREITEHFEKTALRRTREAAFFNGFRRKRSKQARVIGYVSAEGEMIYRESKQRRLFGDSLRRLNRRRS